MDHYEVLGVPFDADNAVIRAAYLALARKHHPDAHMRAARSEMEAAEQRMQQINVAWAVLGRVGERARYDRELSGEPDVPPATLRKSGKASWTPRAGDDGWLEDFDAWAHEGDDALEPDPQRTTTQQSITVLPVILFALSLFVGFVGFAISARPLMAAAFVGLMLAVLALVMLTMFELRGRDHR